MSAGFAKTPAQPYWIVTFTSQRNDVGMQDYADAADRMIELAATQPGFLGVESVRDDDGFGITLSYWSDEASIAAWRDHAEHRATREFGRAHWYDHFEVRVAKVERAYGLRKN
ncbi:antibiotic biosynthesis monooxygenase family protein [Lysobacter sp. HA18]